MQLVPFTVTAMCDKRHEHGLVKLVVGLRSRALVDMKASTLVGWTDSWEPQPRAINELWKDAAGAMKVVRIRNFFICLPVRTLTAWGCPCF